MIRLQRALSRLLVLSLLALLPVPAASALAEELPEWTVMLYLCGSDLESDHALGTYTLGEIASLRLQQNRMSLDESGPGLVPWEPGSINLVLETGGAMEWHTGDADETGRTAGMNVASDRLQRYAYSMELLQGGYSLVPALVDEQPAASMAESQTLADFIRWAAANYPAQKYALVLWDHGGGSRTGLFIDEQFGNDVLGLNGVDQALTDGGIHFEAVVLDACLMSSLEMAQALAPHANYMIASEELTSGYSSAYADWLFELYRAPSWDGGQLGRVICDTTQDKYTQLDNPLAELQLTFSVVDLSKLGPVSEAFDRLFDFAGQLYQSQPDRFNLLCNILLNSESYGMGGADMYDLGSLLYDHSTVTALDAQLRNDLASALDDAVCYSVRGSARCLSFGLSFCYAPNMTAAEMDQYALNCHSAPYLALLDALNPNWTAPDWVYEKARRLTGIESLQAYQMTASIQLRDGLPLLYLDNETGSFRDCFFNLYYLDEDTGEILLLGHRDTVMGWNDEAGQAYFAIEPPRHWPAIDGEMCPLKLIGKEQKYMLYNTPIQIGAEITNLRLRCDLSLDPGTGETLYDFEPLGVWDGYDEETRMPCRAMTDLTELQGRDYTLLYQVCDETGEDTQRYAPSDDLTMSRAPEVEFVPLPEGDYYICFIIEDIFLNRTRTELTRIHWDGESFRPAQ